MHVISEKALRKFWLQHPGAKEPLKAWLDIAEKARWRKFADVRADFGHADQVGPWMVFNIAGNKYRLVTAIHYNRGKVFIRNILTHGEYDKGKRKRE